MLPMHCLLLVAVAGDFCCYYCRVHGEIHLDPAGCGIKHQRDHEGPLGLGRGNFRAISTSSREEWRYIKLNHACHIRQHGLFDLHR